MSQTPSEQIAQAGQWVEQAQNIIVLTGAGVGAESGIATFRDDVSGYWSQFKPEDMASEAGAATRRWYGAGTRAGADARQPGPAQCRACGAGAMGSSAPQAHDVVTRMWTVCMSVRAAPRCSICMVS